MLQWQLSGGLAFRTDLAQLTPPMIHELMFRSGSVDEDPFYPITGQVSGEKARMDSALPGGSYRERCEALHEAMKPRERNQIHGKFAEIKI